MSENKRYYWLQLKKDFFKTRAMKKLRSIAGGDTYTIIYLKMQLLSLENGGLLFHEGVEDDMLEEVALDIDESIDNVRITFNFLEKCNLIELKDDEMYLPEVNENVGSETASAQRVRRFRARRDEKALPSNDGVTSGNVELEKELYNKSKSKSYKEVRHKYGEYKNCFLTDDQYSNLIKEFGESECLSMIKNFDNYVESTGKKYKNHLQTMKNWKSKDKTSNKKDKKSNFDRGEVNFELKVTE